MTLSFAHFFAGIMHNYDVKIKFLEDVNKRRRNYISLPELANGS